MKDLNFPLNFQADELFTMLGGNIEDRLDLDTFQRSAIRIVASENSTFEWHCLVLLTMNQIAERMRIMEQRITASTGSVSTDVASSIESAHQPPESPPWPSKILPRLPERRTAEESLPKASQASLCSAPPAKSPFAAVCGAEPKGNPDIMPAPHVQSFNIDRFVPRVAGDLESGLQSHLEAVSDISWDPQEATLVHSAYALNTETTCDKLAQEIRCLPCLLKRAPVKQDALVKPKPKATECSLNNGEFVLTFDSSPPLQDKSEHGRYFSDAAYFGPT